MPMDSLLTDDQFFYKKADWYYKFAWLPHRCNLSNKRIWLKKAYRGIAMYTGPGDPIFEYKWVSREEFIMARIKGKI
jgi:hypothetical protein